MADLPTQVANWLYSAIQPQYYNKKLTYTHIYQFLQVHLNKNLRFKIRTSIYTSGFTGQSNLLINLTSNIKLLEGDLCQVSLWIPFEYPFIEGGSTIDNQGVPIIYITALSPQCYMKANNYIDTSGRFYHPYLSNWSSGYERDPKNYNLLRLVDVVYQTLLKEIAVQPYNIINNREGTNLKRSEDIVPPIPAKIPLQNIDIVPQPTRTLAHLAMQDTSAKKSPEPIKPRYLSPLPLPSDKNRLASALNMSDNFEALNNQEKKLTQDKVEQFKKEPIIEQKKTLDLVDEVINEEKGQDTRLSSTITSIEQHLNRDLSLQNTSGINSEVSSFLSTSAELRSQYQQFQHQKLQGNANLENLNLHVTYLTQEVEKLEALNTNLIKVDAVNSRQVDAINISENAKISMDDIIIPDSALIGQIYEVSCEIKAIKDLLNAIGGSFESEREIINDRTIEPCLKLTRSLGRELFWLELTRQEIAHSIMNLEK